MGFHSPIIRVTLVVNKDWYYHLVKKFIDEDEVFAYGVFGKNSTEVFDDLIVKSYE